MKPFDLEAAKAGKKVITREGYDYTLLRSDLKNTNYELAGIIHYPVSESVAQHRTDGRWVDLKNDHANDLFMAPEIREYWVNVYASVHGVEVGLFFNSESEAIENMSNDGNYIKTIKIHEEEI